MALKHSICSNLEKDCLREVIEVLQSIIKLEDKVSLFKGRTNKLRR